MTTPETCAQETCSCTRPYSARTRAASTAPLDPDAVYCSRRCEEMALENLRADGCECSHPECTPQTYVDVPPMQ
ncbi:MAG: hypothetical protein QOI11_700 [Candidatus Eremiobacteraeota bacterium]|jgi:hypothetical protein|nr:hypothetical protein [Candidatus Eremiobacteraeota bacterium]